MPDERFDHGWETVNRINAEGARRQWDALSAVSPDFARWIVESAYGDATGHVPRDLDWYLAYAALRQALTSIRVSLRAVHFGEREQPADVNDLVADRPHLERIIT